MKKLSSVLVLFLFIPFFTFASLVGDRTIPVEVAQLSDSLKRMYAPVSYTHLTLPTNSLV